MEQKLGSNCWNRFLIIVFCLTFVLVLQLLNNLMVWGTGREWNIFSFQISLFISRSVRLKTWLQVAGVCKDLSLCQGNLECSTCWNVWKCISMYTIWWFQPALCFPLLHGWLTSFLPQLLGDDLYVFMNR